MLTFWLSNHKNIIISHRKKLITNLINYEKSICHIRRFIFGSIYLFL